MTHDPAALLSSLCKVANAKANEPVEQILGDVPTMLSNEEVHFLHLLARDWPMDDGTIVELGTYLGGSTVAFGRGLLANGREPPSGRIETFDRFEHRPNQRYEIGEGDDTLSRWERHVADVRHLVELHAGDLLIYQRPHDAPSVQVLFVDVVKVAPVINAVVGQFFGSLRPGRSAVIQQDYFHWASPWVVYSMERMNDYFRFCGHVGRNSGVFLLERPLPEELVRLDWIEDIGLDEQLELMECAASRFNHTLRGAVRVSTTTLEAIERPAAARSRLTALRTEYSQNPRLRRYLGQLERRLAGEPEDPATARGLEVRMSVQQPSHPPSSGREGDQELAPLLRSVWDEHSDEAYRRDQSHWRDVGRWQAGHWEQIGRRNLTRIADLYQALGRNPLKLPAPVVMEWGPGGGSNLHALGPHASYLYGVDISRQNLEETTRVLSEQGAAPFQAILLDEQLDDVATAVDRPIDVFLSTAVFQHFPTQEYGRKVLEVVSQVMAANGVGLVQIRFDNGNPQYRPKSVEEYAKRHITANSYELSYFWDMLKEVGLTPLSVNGINTDNNYAYFTFLKKP